MVKTEFSIKDLENLSNVKAHTIRIWEKRYNLLTPERTDTNIRRYDLENLKKLLNITYLYRSGHKISKLAEMDSATINELIKKNLPASDANHAMEIFKTAMIEFDEHRFDATLKKLLEKRSFSDVFSEVFVPLLGETGTLWHSGTIDPSHEHFISEKIKHAIIFQSEKLKLETKKVSEKSFVLYLPIEEIHEIGLLYANYELLRAGFQTLYLGPNIPLESLNHVRKQKSNVVFLTYFTVQPELENISNYIQSFQNTVNQTNSTQLWILGNRASETSNATNIKTFEKIETFLAELTKV